MGDIHYMISEAAKNVGVESHVLRYWEEELELTIGRTEMGHRYYTEEDMQLFHCIRRLKDEGVLLRELKVLIPDIQRAKNFQRTPNIEKSELIKEQSETKKIEVLDKKSKQSVGVELILKEALQNNNKVLEQELCDMVTTSVKQELSYLLDAKEQLEEDRYRKLDTLIRQQQALRKEHGKKGVSVLMKQALGIS